MKTALLVVLILAGVSFGQELPETPVPQANLPVMNRVFNRVVNAATRPYGKKVFWTEVGVYTAFNIADGISTVRNANRGFVETGTPWMYETKPSVASYFGPAFALEGLHVFAAYKLQHSKNRMLRGIGHGLLADGTFVHTKGFIGNVGLPSRTAPAPPTDCLAAGTCMF